MYSVPNITRSRAPHLQASSPIRGPPSQASAAIASNADREEGGAPPAPKPRLHSSAASTARTAARPSSATTAAAAATSAPPPPPPLSGPLAQTGVGGATLRIMRNMQKLSEAEYQQQAVSGENGEAIRRIASKFSGVNVPRHAAVFDDLPSLDAEGVPTQVGEGLGLGVADACG